MQIIDLYRYEDDNEIVITPNKRNETDTPSRVRLVADENCTLTNGTKEIEVIDVMLDEIEVWYEIHNETELEVSVDE